MFSNYFTLNTLWLNVL